MTFKDLLSESVTVIAAHKSRSILLLLGLVIGISAVVTVVSIGDGAKMVLSDILGGYGSKSVLIYPNWYVIETSLGQYEWEEISRDDVRSLNEKIPALVGVIPEIQLNKNVGREGKEQTVQIMGTLPLFLEVNGLEMDQGRGILMEDDKKLRKVGVIGAELKKEFFGEQNAVGEFIHIEDVGEIQIIGVLKHKTQDIISAMAKIDTSYNNTLFIPASSVQRIGGRSEIYFLQGEVVSEDRIEEAITDILAILRYNHGKYGGEHDKFLVESMSSLISSVEKSLKALTLFISLIAGISLAVAGVSVMNIMLVSVKERTREIGVRKALGAAPYVILNQIMLETLLLCGSGGLAGALLSAVAVYTIAHFAHWPALINGKMVLISIALSLVTGLISGLIPASRAADMDPVEALRYE